jgi:putative two-component system response regulator
MAADGRPRVLIVDDTPENLHILNGILKDDYVVLAAVNGEKALALTGRDPPPDIVLLDVMMPGTDGYEVCRRLKADQRTSAIPVLFVTALASEESEAKGLALGAADYITKPFKPDLVKARVQNHLQLKMYRDHLEHLVQERTSELEATRDVAIETLGSISEFRDTDTGGHVRRTMRYIRILAERLQRQPKYADELDARVIDSLSRSAALHDIGKVGIPDGILHKPARLDPDEMAEMKEHTTKGWLALNYGTERLGPDSFLHMAQEMALSHHERWDGKGYPKGLKGEEIPLSGRLMAIADVYDALISHRVYKPSLSHATAVGMLYEGRGTAFDPEILDVFLEMQESFRLAALEFADTDEERANLQPITT